MSRSVSHSTNSSGKCIYCGLFFVRLASHMVSSETCMLASQKSLSSKRKLSECGDEDNFDSNNNKCTSRITRSIAQKSLSHNSSELIENKTLLFLQTSQSVVNSDVDRIYCNDNDMESMSSDCYAAIAMDDYGSQINECNLKPNSSTSQLLNLSTDSIQVVPIEGSTFHRNFTPKEHFMINLCSVCEDANAPLDLVDKVVKVFRDAQSNGLNLESDVIRSREYFLKHLNKRFNTPVPESVDVKVEDPKGNDQTITVIRQNFLTQAMDLIHDHEIWGDCNNFTGTVSMDDPYNSFKHGQSDKKVDEVVDGIWYRQTVEECAKIAKGERFLVLGLIFYCDKTGTDVNQRNSLEPVSFTFCLFNRQCRYKTAAWRTLGYIPDLENMSSAMHSVSRGGFIGKSRSCRNFHACLEVLLSPLIGGQGKDIAIHANVRFGDMVALCRIFFQLHM